MLLLEDKVVDYVPWFKENFSDDQISLIKELQTIHDGGSPYSWKIDYQNLAQKYNLQWKDRPNA